MNTPVIEGTSTENSTNEETIGHITSESRDEIETLCRVYCTKINEKDEEQKTREDQNLLGELKKKLEEFSTSENKNNEYSCQIKDLIQLVTKLEIENDKKSVEMIVLRQTLAKKEESLQTLSQSSKQNICCLETINSNLTEIIKQKDEKITETNALNEKLDVLNKKLKAEIKEKITETNVLNEKINALNEKLNVEINEKNHEIRKNENENPIETQEINLQKKENVEIEKTKITIETKLTQKTTSNDSFKKETLHSTKNGILSKQNINKKPDLSKKESTKSVISTNPTSKPAASVKSATSVNTSTKVINKSATSTNTTNQSLTNLNTSSKSKGANTSKKSVTDANNKSSRKSIPELTLKPKPKTIDELTTELDSEKKKVVEVESRMRQEKDEHASEINLLKSKVENQDTTLLELNNNLSELIIVHDKLQAEHSNNLKSFETMFESEKLLHAQLQETICERNIEIENLTKKYQNEIGELTAELNLIKSELIENKLKLDNIESKLVFKEEQIHVLEEEIEKLHKEDKEPEDIKRKSEINTDVANVEEKDIKCKKNFDTEVTEVKIADESLEEKSKEKINSTSESLEVESYSLNKLEEHITPVKENSVVITNIEIETNQLSNNNSSQSIEDFLWKEIMYENTISKLKKELFDVSMRLKHQESKLENAQVQLDCQMQITEFVRRSLLVELEKKTTNKETTQILLYLSEKLNRIIQDKKNSITSVAETYISTHDSINLRYEYSSDNKQSSINEQDNLKDSQYYKKKHIENLQRKVNFKIRTWMQNKLSQSLHSESFCHAGESALSPPLSNQIRQEGSRFSQILETRDSFQDSGYMENNETVENLIQQVQNQTLLLKNEGVSIPNQWFQEVRKWEEKTLGKVNRLKFSEQEEQNMKSEKNFKSIVYRPSNADVSSIINKVNQEFARSQRMWSSD
ncbi:repetitive organellar protein [Hydra vulgaris]|uniref:Repetitive organellar protein n=1 Tax=Hydra vulgaris TaxID=6087 RepID=A0ABM4C0M7_HYDVU